jgi:hypothetical protein
MDVANTYGKAHNMSTPTEFEVGQIYACRSIGDWNCIWTFKVVARTAKFVTLDDSQDPGILRSLGIDRGDGTVRVGVSRYQGVERCSPIGRYSFSPTLTADKVGPLRPVAVGIVSTQLVGAVAS